MCVNLALAPAPAGLLEMRILEAAWPDWAEGKEAKTFLRALAGPCCDGSWPTPNTCSPVKKKPTVLTIHKYEHGRHVKT